MRLDSRARGVLLAVVAVCLSCSAATAAALPCVADDELVTKIVEQTISDRAKARVIISLSSGLRTAEAQPRSVRVLSYVVMMNQDGEPKAVYPGMPLVESSTTATFDSQAGQPIVKRIARNPADQVLPTHWKLIVSPAAGKTWGDVSDASQLEARLETFWD